MNTIIFIIFSIGGISCFCILLAAFIVLTECPESTETAKVENSNADTPNMSRTEELTMLVTFIAGEETEKFEYPDDTPEEDIDYDYQQWNANWGNGWSKE